MTTFNLPLVQVDASAIQTVITNGVREGRQLDYKEMLRTQESNRSEYLALQAAIRIGGSV